jgi:hypothetical protein
VKDRDVIDAAERRDELRAPSHLQDGTPRAFGFGTRIIINSDNEAIRLSGGGLQVAHMADVQQIETAIREGNRASGGTIRPYQFDEAIARDDLFSHGR